MVLSFFGWRGGNAVHCSERRPGISRPARRAIAAAIPRPDRDTPPRAFSRFDLFVRRRGARRVRRARAEDEARAGHDRGLPDGGAVPLLAWVGAAGDRRAARRSGPTTAHLAPRRGCSWPGCVLFSGSLYALALTGVRALRRRHAGRRRRVARRLGVPCVGGVALVTACVAGRALNRPSRPTPSPPSATSPSPRRCASRNPPASRRRCSRPARASFPWPRARRATSRSRR